MLEDKFLYDLTQGISILGCLLLWEENKRQLIFQEIGSQLVTAPSGFGTQYMLGKFMVKIRLNRSYSYHHCLNILPIFAAS